MNDKYYPKVGDVVLDNDIAMVIVNINSYEDAGSCGYSREYLVVSEEYLKNVPGLVLYEDILNHGRIISVTGDTFPTIEKIEHIAPYDIQEVTAFTVRQKKAKTVTIYE